MHRRDFLRTTGAAALAAGTLAALEQARAADRLEAEQRLAAPASSRDGVRHLRLVSGWPEAAAGPGDEVRRLAARIAAASGGRWHIDVDHHGGSGFAAVMTGAADLYVASEVEHVVHHPALAYFGALPIDGALGALGLAAWTSVGGGQELWDELCGDFNVKALLCGHGGRGTGLWSMQPDRPATRIAAFGLAPEVLAGIGLTPVAMTRAAGVAAALAAGDADVVETLDGSLATAMTLRDAGARRVGRGMTGRGAAWSLGMRRSFWDGLAECERIMLSALAAEAYAHSVANRRMEQAMARALSVTGTAATLDIWRRSRQVRDAVVAEVAGRDAISRAIDRSYMAFRAALQAGRRVA